MHVRAEQQTARGQGTTVAVQYVGSAVVLFSATINKYINIGECLRAINVEARSRCTLSHVKREK